MSDRDEIDARGSACKPLEAGAFNLSDHIVECDQPIASYLNSRIHGD